MELVYKAQIFALFAIPAILGIGAAEAIKELSKPSKFLLYGFGLVSTGCAFVVPWLK